jgi:hypothetical protein
VKAEIFFKRLDHIRAETRAAFGMKDKDIPFDSAQVQALVGLLEAVQSDTNATPAPLEAEKQEPVIADTQIEFNLGSASVSSKTSVMTVTPLPRDPKPVHPIVVEPANEDTVAAPSLGWQEGDI